MSNWSFSKWSSYNQHIRQDNTNVMWKTYRDGGSRSFVMDFRTATCDEFGNGEKWIQRSGRSDGDLCKETMHYGQETKEMKNSC